MDFYGVAKRVVEGRHMDLAVCCGLEQKCDKKNTKKSKTPSNKSANKTVKKAESKNVKSVDNK